MGDRRELGEAHSALQKTYEDIKQQMIDKKASPEQLAKLNRMYQDRYNNLKSTMGDSLQKLNIGEKIPVQGGTFGGIGDNQNKLPDMGKQVNLGKEGMFSKAKDIGGDVLGSAKKAGFKKLLGAVPLLGGLASAAMTGDASAAIPGLDSAESAGPAKGSMDDQIQQGNVSGPDLQRQMEENRQQMLEQSPNEEDDTDIPERHYQLNSLKRLLQQKGR